MLLVLSCACVRVCVRARARACVRDVDGDGGAVFCNYGALAVSLLHCCTLQGTLPDAVRAIYRVHDGQYQ